MLVRLLWHTLGSDFFYCEFYEPEDCCRSIPCQRAKGRLLSLQKNHDFFSSVPRDLTGTPYLVQMRAPIPATLSARERILEQEPADSPMRVPEAYHHWIADRTVFYINFFQRWVAEPPANSILIPYETLVADPEGTVAGLLRRLGITVPARALAEAVATVVPQRNSGQPYCPRPLHARSAYDPDLLAPMETVIRDHVPAFGEPHFPPVDRANTPWYHFLNGAWFRHTGQTDRALGAFRYAHLLASHRPEPMAAAAELLMAENRYEEALALARPLHTRAPGSTHTWRLANILLTLERFDEAVDLCRHLIRHEPDNAFYWNRLAVSLMHSHRLDEALPAFREACALAPTDATARYNLAVALSRGGRQKEARAAAARACELDPQNHAYRTFQATLSQ